jgi:Phage integrase, N-terminal SAM-like domain
MGVSIRDKHRNGVWWIFVRHAGQRVSELIGSHELALEVKDEVERDIRLGRYDIAKVRAARAPVQPAEPEKPKTPTVEEYYKRFEKVYLQTACRQGTRDRYATSYKYILPKLGSIPLNEITRERVKDFVATLVAKRYEKRLKVKTYPDPEVQRKQIITWKVVQAPLSKTRSGSFSTNFARCSATPSKRR